MATTARTKKTADKPVVDDNAQNPVQEQQKNDAAQSTALDHTRAAIAHIEAAGAERTRNDVNALAYLRQAQAWLEKDQ